MAGDGLVPPLNAPPAGQPLPGVQPGVTNGIIIANIVIIFGPTGSATGLFVYQPGTTPGAGNPPIAWITANAKDPYGNTLQPGIMLAEASGTGNAEGGLIWNTATPGAAEPLVALYPNATVGFTGNAPFMLGRVFNRGLVNELLALAFGGGGTAGTSPVQFEIFSQSKDGTVLGHVSFYDWASTNLICDVNVNGIIAADPNNANTLETWHTITLDSGWTGGAQVPQYRLLPDGNVQVRGVATHTSVTANTNINASTPISAAYRPAQIRFYRAADPSDTAGLVQINTGGVFQVHANATFPATQAVMDGTYSLA